MVRATSIPETSYLRFLICGSVGDGKSTLIGRLLQQSMRPPDSDHEILIRDPTQHETQADTFELLMDGLQAEREQRRPINAAYRCFSTQKRRFVVADTPGQEEYTRNMAAVASDVQLAVILVDARNGVLLQTRRHSRIVNMMGLHHVIVGVNKMDLVDWDEQVFRTIQRDYVTFARDLNFKAIHLLPISALHGDNVVNPSARMKWCDVPPLLTLLDSIDVEGSDDSHSFCLPVQWVNRPNDSFRGCCGRIASGSVQPGDRIRVSPSGMETSVSAVVSPDGPLDFAVAGESVTLTLVEEIDVRRGDVISAAKRPVEVADQFEAQLLWLSHHELVPGRLYAAKIHNERCGAAVTDIKYRVDVTSGAKLAAKSLSLNDIAVVNISFDRSVPFASYSEIRALGAFILIDRLTHETLGAGTIRYALRRSANLHWQAMDVTKEARAALMHQRPCCVWFTGLSGSGKSTIANLLDKRLHCSGHHTYVLDGDNLRHGLNRDLGFTEADRAENVRRVAEVARLMVDAGLIVIASFISPYKSERAFARSLFKPREFVEVFVDTPLYVCEERDPKGLYAKARAGKLPNFTGYDSPYEAPEAAEIVVDTTKRSADDAAENIALLVLEEERSPSSIPIRQDLRVVESAAKR